MTGPDPTDKAPTDKAPTVPDAAPASQAPSVLPYRPPERRTPGVDRTVAGATVPARAVAALVCLGLILVAATGRLPDVFSVHYWPVDLAWVAVFALCLAVAWGRVGRHVPGHI